MGFTAVSGLLNGITCILMGAFVYFKNRSAEVNKSYSLLSLGLAVWSFSYFFWQISNDRQSAMFWVRLLTVGSILIPSFYLNFILSLLKLGDKRKKIFITAFLSSLIFIPFCFNNLLIRDLKPKLGFKFWPDAGTLYLPFLVFFFLCVIYSCYLIIKRFKKLSSVGQNQIKYVFIASVAGFLGGSTNYPLWYNIPIPPIGNFLVSIHVFILAYAIVKYRLMAINVVITRAGIFLAVYTVVLGLPFVLSTSGKNHLVNILGPNWWIGPLVLMAFLGTLGPFVYIYLRKKADAILLKEQLRYQDILKLAAVDMTRIRNLQKLLDFIARTITESVCIRHSAIYYFNPEAKRFEMKAGINPKKNQPAVIDLKNELVVWLEKNKLPLAYEEINDRSGNHPDFVILEKQMRLLNASLALPCILENKLLNIIILGDKLSGNTYTTDDLDNFLILAKETALATENAQLYGKIEEDIKQRTKDLIELQKQLIQAEKLATVGTLAGGVAHEINNPLTAILTNVQMLLRSGELDKESLEMIEEATKRCRTIVQKLMAYAKKPLAETAVFSKINLKTIINNTVAFLRYQLEQDNIKISIKAPAEAYLVEGNHNELEQVITNIILNAKDAIKQIKKSGIIDITLSQAEGWVKIEIEDEGTGIPENMINRIFDPFFTTKDVGKGLGLGLSICQSIIKKHKGKISLRSNINRGTVFTVTLPGLNNISIANILKDGGRDG